MNKPYAESCDQNRAPIGAVIEPLFAARTAVLEIGSGTGQHAVWFSARMPQLTWHATDRAENHPGIRLWMAEAGLPNLRGPWELDVTRSAWPEIEIDAAFSANTAHIMHLDEVAAMFRGVGARLPVGGIFALYGPFNRDGGYTSESNRRFDGWLKERDPESGIKDLDELKAFAAHADLRLEADHPMPANNRTLCWRKTESVDAG